MKDIFEKKKTCRVKLGIIPRQSVNSQCKLTKAIDSIIPMKDKRANYRDRQTGKTAVAVDTIINQSH